MSDYIETHFDNIDKIIINRINTASKSIKIAVAWITDTNIINSLNKCCNRGIKITIIINNDKINNLDKYEYLYNEGSDILLSNKMMHNKFCIIDDKIVINGSYNWTRNAKQNQENITIFHSDTIIIKFLNEFQKLKENSINAKKHYLLKTSNINDYLSSLNKPKKYPVLYKIDISNKHIEQQLNLPKLKINNVYKILHNEIDFLSVNKSLYKSKYNNDYSYYNLNTIIYENYDNYWLCFRNKSMEHVLIIDVIKELNSEIKIDSDTYFESKSCYNEDQFIYINDYNKENFLFIGINFDIKTLYDRNPAYDKNNIYVFIAKIDIDNNKIKANKFSYRNISIEKDYAKILLTQNVNVELENINREKYYYTGLRNVQTRLNSYLYLDKNNFKILPISKVEYENNYSLLKSKKLSDSIEKNKQQRLINSKTQRGGEPTCYIATAIYKSPDHTQVMNLRLFRDNFLYKYEIGKLLVKFYYKASPKFIKYLNNKIINYMVKALLELIIKIIPKYIIK